MSDIADQFGVSADSILWANAKLEDNPDMLSLGQVLNIPPTSGVLVTVQNGDTLTKIVDRYRGKKPADQIVRNVRDLEFNQERHALDEANPALTPGQFLMIPEGSRPFVQRTVTSYSGPIPSTAKRGTGSFGLAGVGSHHAKIRQPAHGHRRRCAQGNAGICRRFRIRNPLRLRP